ncbi:hypothetical protein FRC96_05670 [Lujinxingia vulgaris]|uniref:Uncharacterized protein n=1 Tax=Lujinxingia vulgaris TaxID=2600176 RepID=A0A5C6XIF7_9DELT|nr:hypothetical protein [Lujinxingia vulgaris]TXD39760.1 hypothetical protein FRC96_05670 [Lujinxingia vulgaris]
MSGLRHILLIVSLLLSPGCGGAFTSTIVRTDGATLEAVPGCVTPGADGMRMLRGTGLGDGIAASNVETIRSHAGMEGEVEGLVSEDRALKLRLTTGESLEVQRVLLATGFRSERPGGAMLDELITSASLPCADCGYPIVDASLRWHPRVHVCGPLAELELGPASRNIAGARRAGDRLVSVARAQRTTGRWQAS